MRLIRTLLVCGIAAAIPAAAVAVETKDVPGDRRAAAPARTAASPGMSRLAAVTKENKERAKKGQSSAKGGKASKSDQAKSKPADPPKPPPVPAKQLFGAATGPAPLAARAIGSYAKGCLAGAQPLAIDGPAWQAMRLSRNRNWGHPQLIKLIERLATEAKDFDGWPGLLVGDISQPRGGPMLTGHASHQIGLDADIWFTPMPDRRLTPKEREVLAATSMLTPDSLAVNAEFWTPAHVQIVKRAASYREVERVFVHPAIKKALCETASGDRRWLSKVRPIWGHYYHFHVRMDCPTGSATCETQAPPPGDDGCGKELTDWYALLTKPAPPPPTAAPPPVTATPAKPAPPKPALTMAELPNECRVVLDAGSPNATAASQPAVQPAAASTAAGKPHGPAKSAQQ